MAFHPVDRILTFASLGLELAFPRECILCGSPLLATRLDGSPYEEALGLCHECLHRLEPIGGERCSSCGKGLISEIGHCMRCRTRKWSFDEARPVFAYRGEAEALVAAYKFGGRRSLASLFSRFLEGLLAENWPAWPVVPVPFRREKLRKKGWDQVEDLAMRLEVKGHKILRILERLPSEEQKKLALDARFINAGKAYRLRPGARVPPQVVLLDDVFTTGATAEACASALKGGGAEVVAFLSIAAD